jgi:hypothetical protein
MKTTKNLGNSQQLDKYLAVRERVSNEGGGFFIEDIKEITSRSKQKEKYSSLFKNISIHEKIITNSKNLKIFYLVPRSLNRRLLLASNIDSIFTFSDLPESIGNEFDPEWKIIKLALEELDKTKNNSLSAGSSQNQDNTFDGNGEFASLNEIDFKVIEVRIRKQIIKYLGPDYPSVVPVYVRLGTTGKGLRPNYQVEFSNNRIVAFRSFGQVYKADFQFNGDNLTGWKDWENFGVE